MKSVIIVAGGASKRFGKNKLKEEIFDKSVLQHSVDAFLGIADEIIVVGKYSVCGAKCVKAGSTRNKSVRNGVKAVSPQCTLLAIHDGARPFVSRSLVQKLFDEAQKFGSAVPCLPVTDTLWENTDGVAQRRERNNFFTVQTPQVFHYEKLVCALQNFPKDFPDESTLFSQAYGEVHFVEGERSNRKLTVAQDLPVYRVGNGFDVHAFGEGNGFVLGGVHIPFDKKLLGHSDADVLCHAICDAVLSASGNKDIGWQFPDTDDAYLGADSMKLLEQCVALAEKSDFCVENVSAVVICQRPKIAPYLDEMAQKLATVLKIASSCVSISATTTEKLGALGNGDGIACQATVLLSQKL